MVSSLQAIKGCCWNTHLPRGAAGWHQAGALHGAASWRQCGRTDTGTPAETQSCLLQDGLVARMEVGGGKFGPGEFSLGFGKYKTASGHPLDGLDIIASSPSSFGFIATSSV